MTLNNQKINEVWKDVRGYEGLYQISNYGNVLSLNYNHTGEAKLLKLRIDKDGYTRIGLSNNGFKKDFYVHRLVGEHFVENPNNYPKINHKDMSPNKSKGIPVNNYYENIEWCTVQYNNTYGDRIEKTKITKKERNSYGAERVVLQYDLNNNLIHKWNSVMDIQLQLGYLESGIRRCCYEISKTSHGFVWKYEVNTNAS